MSWRTTTKHVLVATVFILLITIIQSYYQANIARKVFAQSPSFVRQEIIDDADDWIFWKGSSLGSSNKVPLSTHDGSMVEVDRANNSSECQLGNNSNDDLHFPDIQSVSYDGDEKT